jgi:hypothetical protein
MAESDALAGIGNLTNALLAHQLHHEDVASLLADRHGDVTADKRQPGIDHFVRTDLDGDDARHQQLMASLRRISDHFQIQSAQVSTSPAGAAQASQFAISPTGQITTTPTPGAPSHAVSAPTSIDTSGADSSATGQSNA